MFSLLYGFWFFGGIFFFFCLSQERRNGRGLFFFFSMHVRQPVGKSERQHLLQNENLEGTSPFTFVFYGTTGLNKAYCYFAVT